MTQDRKPDWDFWSNVPDLTIMEALVLSMEHEPKHLGDRPDGGWRAGSLPASPEFKHRFELVKRNLRTLSVSGIDERYELKDCWVERSKFAAVTRSWGWKIPPEMAAWAEPDERDAEILSLKQHVEALTKERDSWESEAAEVQKQLKAGRDHYSEKLATLIQAARTFWANADPHDRQTHSENPEVIAWLMKNGYSSILAKKGATIIRPKWAPIGRKPKE